ncbi:MAG: DUF3156 family protein [Comamonas sp.]
MAAAPLAAPRVAPAPRPPRVRGYRPGLTLAHLRHDLDGLPCEAAKDPPAGLRLHAHGLDIAVRERVEPHFLMHLVQCEFMLDLDAPTSAAAGARIDVRHTGWLRRTGLAYGSHGLPAASPLPQALRQDSELAAHLMPLDFVGLALHARPGGWQVRLTHIGASEVVSRLPAMRRYVRLAAAQRAALLGALARIAAVVRQTP